MDRVEHYRHCIGELLNRYAQCWNEEGIETQLIVDTIHDLYLLLKTGWDGEQRIYYSVFHFDIKDGKIWIQENNTDVEADQELNDMGISKKEMVVGFHHPSMCEYSEFALS